MRCADELSVVLLDIISAGILRIRRLAEAQQPDRCSIEADHIHNLPALLSNYSLDLLLFYWNTERPSFIEQSDNEDIRSFDAHWDKLDKYISDMDVHKRIDGLGKADESNS